ncbi:hypothetical protein ACSVDE_01155 [Pseudalkalibacillus sp. Hm43]|uniref:hypothetical protein n=1 Tax=Pseudalkalibacillus sp. Hm43 TaxID=3450742 RepID=UPI003F441AEC
MKKLLFIFLIGQFLLLSYIFNKSLFDIYELNHLGDSTLDAYIVEDLSGDRLNALYEEIDALCLSDQSCRVQLIKTPVSENNQFVYEIYHSELDEIAKPASISSDTIFNYYPLQKEDFIDNNGVFYTDLQRDEIDSIASTLGVTIEPYENTIAYGQVLKYNLLNFTLLLVLSQLVLFIYTFTRIKVNAVKKMLGFSNMKMILGSLKDFVYMEGAILLGVLCTHFFYYLFVDQIVLRYFYLLAAFMLVVALCNIILLLITQTSLRFIDINLMIKNKVYSNKLNYALYGLKIVLILSITVSISSFMSNYTDYKEKMRDLEQYKQLNGYFTSNGYNYEEDTIARKQPERIAEYGQSIQNLYEHFEARGQLYVNDAYLLELLSPSYLEIQGLKKEDIFNSLEENHIVVNERYFKAFMNLHDENGVPIDNLEADKPTLLVPVKYMEQEDVVRNIYQEKFEHLMNYNEFFGIENENPKRVEDLNILYMQNGQEYALLGQNVSGTDIKLRDTIVMLDTGNFDSLYYYDLLNAGDVYFQLDERDEFSQAIAKFDLQKLVNVGTLLTPYMDRVHYTEFVMYNSLVFTVLFLFTLIFVIYISNFVDVTSNNKRYIMQFIYGYDGARTFKVHFIIYIMLLGMIGLHFFVDFNAVLYIGILAVDLLILFYLYKKLVSSDLHKIVKGG